MVGAATVLGWLDFVIIGLVVILAIVLARH